MSITRTRKKFDGSKGPLLLPSKPEQNPLVSADRSSDRLPQLRGSATIFRFGPFEVNLDRRELRKYGMKIRLEEKPFDVLEALLREPGTLVTRETLRAKLW